jgi:sortase (surface protein transpeptidase)
VLSIGVHTTGLIDLGLTPSGAMEVPKDAVTAGWFDLGPTPGELGPSVIAAHVDYAKVPGVFARLHEMAVGDEALVTRADGSTVRFTAYRVERFPKSAFPTSDVYGNTDGPELRLVTCGGEYDRASGSYRDNVVVFARLAG